MSQGSRRTSSASPPPESASTGRSTDRPSSPVPKLRVRLERRDALDSSADVVVSGLFLRPEGPSPLPPRLAREDQAVGGAIGAAWERREIRGKRTEIPTTAEITTFHRPGGGGRVVLAALGPVARASAETVRRAAAEVVRSLRGRGARTVAFRLPSFVAGRVDPSGAARALADGALLGSYEFTSYRREADPGIAEVTIHLGPDLARRAATVERALGEEATILDSVAWTRDLANLPANEATPERIAAEARALAKEAGLAVQVFDETALAQLRCGGLLAVGSGSSHPPRMIVLEYPGRTKGPAPTVALVGKGITFDSGGISIKDAPQMSNMKFDKSGAVAVLGVLRACAALRVPIRVVGVLCCAENLPSGTSYRPGDLVRTFNGTTIEVLNTDAEGRVVLADGLGWVVQERHPDALVDVATLTGAEVVALGDDTAGLVSTNDRLAARLLAASRATGEPLWRMPLTDYHRVLVRSDVADVRNSIEMTVAGMLTASAFLEKFVGSTPWAHVDIAGPAYTTISTRKYQPAYQNIGATAFAVRLLTRFLLDYRRR
jgi:leucyl aminopeptidase